MSRIWYHGSPIELTVLRAQSTITPDRHLAEVFSHKPSIVSMADDGTIRHNGAPPGYLYRIDEPIGPDDLYAHPRSAMPAGLEWLTRRDLRLTLIGPTQVVDEERLTADEIAALQRRADTSSS